MEIPDKFIANLKEAIEEYDYCYLCKNHSFEHAEDCPLNDEKEKR